MLVAISPTFVANTKIICRYDFLAPLIVSRTKMSELYFYKCAHFLSYLFLSPLFVHQLHSNTKILSLISLIPTSNYLIPFIPIIPTLIPHIPIILILIHRISIIPLIPFPDSPFGLLQIVYFEQELWWNTFLEVAIHSEVL